MVIQNRPIFLFLIIYLFICVVSTDNVLSQNREILNSKSPSDSLKKIAMIIQNPNSAKVLYKDLKRQSNYFARISPRKYVLSDKNEVKEDAVIGTKPYIFLTTPESIYGRSLLDIYLDIGYEAEDIIRWQQNEDMVAIVFRYPAEISISDVKDGSFPDDWNKQVYIPTWDNIFSLFGRLAIDATIEPDKKGEFAPKTAFFRSLDEKNFVLSFPDIGKQRIKTSNYNCLKAMGGSDWMYRKLLENKLNIFEHFMGNGRTHNEIIDPDCIYTEDGLLEFVGPNMKIKELPEFIIIHLGKLTISDTYQKH